MRWTILKLLGLTLVALFFMGGCSSTGSHSGDKHEAHHAKGEMSKEKCEKCEKAKGECREKKGKKGKKGKKDKKCAEKKEKCQECEKSQRERKAAHRMECELGQDKRWTEVRKAGEGCSLAYFKAGVEEVVASSASGDSHCKTVQERIRTNLEKAGFSC